MVRKLVKGRNYVQGKKSGFFCFGWLTVSANSCQLSAILKSVNYDGHRAARRHQPACVSAAMIAICRRVGHRAA